MPVASRTQVALDGCGVHSRPVAVQMEDRSRVLAMTADRLDELETYRPDDDTPPDAKVRIPAGDLRDLVALIPVVRAALDTDRCENASHFCALVGDAVIAMNERTDAE